MNTYWRLMLDSGLPMYLVLFVDGEMMLLETRIQHNAIQNILLTSVFCFFYKVRTCISIIMFIDYSKKYLHVHGEAHGTDIMSFGKTLTCCACKL